jgi:hypothetical protein
MGEERGVYRVLIDWYKGSEPSALMHLGLLCQPFVPHRVLVGKPEGKRPLGRPRHRWEDNIKMYLQEVGEGRGDWMELAQDRDGWRGTCEYGKEPSGSIKCGEFLG